MRAACVETLTDPEEGMKRLEGLARFLEHEYESAARSLREGMAGEMFTIQRLRQLPPTLYKCLGTTNVIESPQSGVQKRTDNVTRWRDACDMSSRSVGWPRPGFLTEKHFRKVASGTTICGPWPSIWDENKLPTPLRKWRNMNLSAVPTFN